MIKPTGGTSRGVPVPTLSRYEEDLRKQPGFVAGLVLHVDHIHPRRKGGPTTQDNLQTLCEKCNIGKSDLPMTEDEHG